MIVGTELRAWCQDKAAQAAARAEADALTTAWNEGPAHRGFVDAMAGLDAPSAEAVAAKMVELFRDEPWLDALVDQLADALRRNPYFEAPFRHTSSEVHNGLIVYEDENVSIGAGVTSVAGLAEKKRQKGRRASIAFSGQVEIFKFVKAGQARLSLWEAPRISADFTAGTAGRCWQTGARCIEDGAVLMVDGRWQSFSIDHAASNLVVLQATVKPDRAPLSVEYDSVSHEFVGCSAADDSASRIQMIATLLRKLDDRAVFPVLAEFLDHPSFFVRWHVMRELLGLDVEAALPHLERMAARDRHPETRRAARNVIESIGRLPAGVRRAA